jgi:hypothetical protein
LIHLERKTISIYLEFGFACQTDDDKQHDGYQVDPETGPVVNVESHAPGADNHQENGSGSDNSSDHQQNLQSGCDESIGEIIKICEFNLRGSKCKGMKCCR